MIATLLQLVGAGALGLVIGIRIGESRARMRRRAIEGCL